MPGGDADVDDADVDAAGRDEFGAKGDWVSGLSCCGWVWSGLRILALHGPDGLVFDIGTGIGVMVKTGWELKWDIS